LIQEQPKANATEPLVSILIPSYNAEQWIGQCIESALGQSYSNIEVIVSDDGSTDGTVREIKRFGDRIRFIESEHAGANAVRNRLTGVAKGEWLQYLDSDDYLLPNKIMDQIGFMKANEWKFDVAYSPMIVRKENTNTEYPTVIEPADDPTVHFFRWSSFCTHGILLRRSAVLEVGGWNNTQPVCQEHELLLRLFMAGKTFGLWNHAAAVYRYHGTGTISTKSPLRTMQVRMALTDNFEEWLKSTGRLTRACRKAVYIARVETARNAWANDAAYAFDLIRTAERKGRFWVLSNSAVPLSLQVVWRACGFRVAQNLARRMREFRKPLGAT